MDYRLVNRRTSREWSRTKRYSRVELEWLARRRGLDFKDEHGRGIVLSKDGREVVRFLAQPDPPPNAGAVVFSR